MKRTLAMLLTAVLLAVAVPVQATQYGGYVRNWWVEPSGDVVFYFLSNSDVNTTTTGDYLSGYCGSPRYRIRTTNANFDEAYSSLLFAAKNNAKVWMDVSSCSGTFNLIDQVKVCTWLGDC